MKLIPVSKTLLGFLVIGWISITSVCGGEELDSALAKLEQDLNAIKPSLSKARQRLAYKRAIKSATIALQKTDSDQLRWGLLEFSFRAQRRLVSVEGTSKNKDALLATCRELVKAPIEFAEYRLEADLLLSQVRQAEETGTKKSRSEALWQFVNRYVGTSAGAKALRNGIVMALEFGDTRLVNELRKLVAEQYSNDLSMITFLRDHLGGQVFGVPFVGHFKSSDGKLMKFPMDGLGHSCMLIFWSKDNDNILQYLKNMAAAYEEDRDRVDGRLEIISVNLDELPDAGESIIRELGANWTCLHFPGGRENPKYKAYVRRDLLNLRVAPTGQVAMVMQDSVRQRKTVPIVDLRKGIKQVEASENLKNYTESFRRTLIRSWSRDSYALHLSALMSGDFLIFDPEGEFDPSLPPELKGAAKGREVEALQRVPDSVPEHVLGAIQECLIPPPRRYHVRATEVRNSYEKMRDLCLKALKNYPSAPDLWIVKNRLIIAYMGLWKTDFQIAYFEAAVALSRETLTHALPPGCDLIARFCLARQALRDPKVEGAKSINEYVEKQGGVSASGPVFATASLLALDTANEALYNKFRGIILSDHTEYSMMWIYTSFLLSRYHHYWMFQVPFSAGWSFGRRMKFDMNKVYIEDSKRFLRAELETLDGKPFRVPEDLEKEYTILVLAQPQPWKGKDREDPRPPSPANLLRSLPQFVVSRSDLDLKMLMLGETEEQTILENLKIRNSKVQLGGPILRLEKGMNNPLVHRLGLLNSKSGAVILKKDGRIITTLSGEAMGSVYSVFPKTIEALDEIKVKTALEQGKVESARKWIMKLAPPYDPNALDSRGRKLRKPEYGIAHIRARAQVYLALKDYQNALADAELILAKELAAAGGMSIRTQELDEAEAFRDKIKRLIKK